MFTADVLIVYLAGIILQPAYADCSQDSDWPEKPCLDTPPYAEEYLKATWEEYYEYKGQAWMEMKKTEMDQAIKDGTLNEWVAYRSAPDNFANYNVYFYYFLNDQAPDINDFSNSFMRARGLPTRIAPRVGAGHGRNRRSWHSCHHFCIKEGQADKLAVTGFCQSRSIYRARCNIL